MTDRKHLKSRVRARMERTGERYAAARAHVVAAGDQTPMAPQPSDTGTGQTDRNPGANAGRLGPPHRCSPTWVCP